MPQFRKTWRHEVYIEADTAEEAQEIWESVKLGRLDHEAETGVIKYHDIVGEVSFEDEDYNDIDI